ncbi:MAG TPA: DUF6249 domain-containing protein [Myxococcota bacterium]
MSRLGAILMLCLAVAAPAIGAEPAEIPAASPVGSAEPAPASAAVPELEDLPLEILERLDPEQIADILEAREETKIVLGSAGGKRSDLVAILLPLGLFLTILLGMIATLVMRYRKHGQLQETLRLMIEKGVEIPTELIAPPASRYGDLRRGIVLLSAGIALSIFIGLEDGFGGGDWAVGLVPAFIGAGYLLIWRLSQRDENR